MKPENSSRTLDRALMVVALGVGLWALLAPRNDTPVDLEPLRREITTLRRSVDELRRQQGVAAPEIAEGVAPDGAGLRSLQEAVGGLDQRLASLEQRIRLSPVGALIVPPASGDAAQLRQTATNAAIPTVERMAALRGLRAANARTPDVVQAMMELVAQSPEGAIRADIFRQLSGVDDPALRGPLLNALRTDGFAGAREEAAETMSAFLADPEIRTALAAAIENDPDQRVRAQAQSTLGGARGSAPAP